MQFAYVGKARDFEAKTRHLLNIESDNEMKHACGLDITHCDECSVELEPGQVGKCGDCLDTASDLHAGRAAFLQAHGYTVGAREQYEK